MFNVCLMFNLPFKRSQSDRCNSLARLVIIVLMLTALPGGVSVAGAAPDSSPNRASNNPALVPWWSHFNDPLLGQLIERALQSNTSIQTAKAALQQAVALRDVKGAALLPGLTLSGSVQRSTSDLGDASRAANSLKTGLDARWDMDIWGANRSALDASAATALAADATLADVQLSIAAEMALAYIQLRGLQAQQAIARTNLSSQQDTLQITQWRAQAGLATLLDVEQARTATEQTLALMPLQTAGIAKAQHSLAVLTGQRPAELDKVLQTVLPVPQMALDLSDGIPAQTLRHRADVRAAEHRVSAALALVSAAEGARYPGFSLGGSLGLGALTLSGLGSAALAGSLLGSISVPLMDGGATKNQVLAQQSALEQARMAYQSTVLAALQDVADAAVALHQDRIRLDHLQKAADAAETAARLAGQRYASGLIDFQTVLVTQRSLLGAQDSLAAEQATLGGDQVRLIKALGGDLSH